MPVVDSLDTLVDETHSAGSLLHPLLAYVGDQRGLCDQETIGGSAMRVTGGCAEAAHASACRATTRERNREHYLFRFLKRAFDVVFSLVVLAVALAPGLVLSVVIALQSKGSPIYVDHRVGRGGRPLGVLKFRSMVCDADNVEKYLSAEQLAQWQSERKVENDPRITPVGRIIRKLSIDELPQFLNVLVGQMRYRLFEKKYSRRVTNGEIKSTTIKQGQFERGFASLSKDAAAFIDDFLGLFDEKILIYISSFSKMEYIIRQVFAEYKNTLLLDMDLLKYSVTKAIIVYCPEEVISSLYGTPSEFIGSLKDFLRSRIEADRANTDLKSREIEQFELILLFLDNAAEVESFDWSYENPLIGLKFYIQEKSICKYSLVIDREARTAESAQNLGLDNVSEGESKELFALQMADMLAGIVAKLMKALAKAFEYHSAADTVKKNLLDEGWFKLTEERLGLYKSLYRVVMQLNNAWYKVFSGVYTDDLICFTTFLSFINSFSSVDELKSNLQMMPEYFNTAACNELANHYIMVSNKLPIVPINSDNGEYFLNGCGTKEFFDIDRQPSFYIDGGARTCDVLSVGVRNGKALVTIKEDAGAVCYVFPDDLFSWAEGLVALANRGMNLFPEEVTFTEVDGRLAADIH